MKQEIKKEVVLQMIWDRHFDLGMEKDLDDICEDIYNEVFVPLLKRAGKQTAKEIFTKLIEVANNQYDKGKISIGLLKAWAIEYGVEVE